MSALGRDCVRFLAAMDFCIMPLCRKSMDINSEKVFYNFPRGQEGAAWARSLLLPESLLILCPLVCEDHFDEESFDPVTGCLLRGAVPYVLARPPDWDLVRPIMMHLRKEHFLRMDYMKQVRGLPRPRSRRRKKRAKDFPVDRSELMLPPSRSRAMSPVPPGLVNLQGEMSGRMALHHGVLVVRKVVDVRAKRDRRIGMLLLAAYNNTLRGKLGLVNTPVEDMLLDLHKRL